MRGTELRLTVEELATDPSVYDATLWFESSLQWLADAKGPSEHLATMGAIREARERIARMERELHELESRLEEEETAMGVGEA